MHECLKKRKLFSLERLDNILGGESFSYQHFTPARREGENEPPPPTPPEEIENGALFEHTVYFNLSLSKQSFSKTLFKPEKFANAGFSSSCGRKTF